MRHVLLCCKPAATLKFTKRHDRAITFMKSLKTLFLLLTKLLHWSIFLQREEKRWIWVKKHLTWAWSAFFKFCYQATA